MTKFLLFSALLCFQDEFSGPQKEELLPDCRVKVIFGPAAGKEMNLLKEIAEKPNLILFVHEVTRPSVGLARTVANYAGKRRKDGLVSNVIFLTSDPTETENWMNRAKRALPQGMNVSISVDGIEGPGAFGLNRKMQVTGIVANKNKVTANFAIVQPSVQADAQKICQEIAKVLGDKKMPTPQDLGIASPDRSPRSNGKFEQLMRPFIQKTATDEEIEQQARTIEAAAMKDQDLKKRIYNVTKRIVDNGKLSNYGTQKAQGYLKKWAKEMGKANERPKGSKKN